MYRYIQSNGGEDGRRRIEEDRGRQMHRAKGQSDEGGRRGRKKKGVRKRCVCRDHVRGDSGLKKKSEDADQ